MQVWLKEKLFLKYEIKKQLKLIQQEIQNIELKNIKLPPLLFSEHHLSHASAAYFGSPFDLNKETLILTCDGAGDGLSATVSIANGLEIKRISSTNRKASVGKIYSRVTYMLGLKPWEHEYKVMGLAPYAENKFALEIKNILSLYPIFFPMTSWI